MEDKNISLLDSIAAESDSRHLLWSATSKYIEHIADQQYGFLESNLAKVTNFGNIMMTANKVTWLIEDEKYSLVWDNVVEGTLPLPTG